MQRALVTGGAGYIGSVLTFQLLKAGYQVRVLDNLMYGGHSLLAAFGEENFDFHRGDVRQRKTVERALEDIDALVHLAAIVGDPACARQPGLARQVNLDASLQMLELAQRAGKRRFIFASTCSNYGRMADSTEYVDEESELRPISLYAETKVAVEQAIASHPSQEGFCPTVLRFATVYGISPRMRFDLTVNEFTMDMLVNKHLVVFGEQFWRPYIHVRDAARAIAMVLDAPLEKVRSKVFNVGDTSQNYQKGQLVKLICAQLGDEVEIEHVHKEEDPRDYRVSFEKIKRELGFHITRTVEDGIREVIDAIRQGVITDFDNPCYRN